MTEMLKYQSLKENQLNEWYELCGSVFGVYNYHAEYFRAHYENDPWKNLEGIFVASDGDRLVSSVRVFSRKIYCNGGIVSMAGIGEVCTLPDYRKNGISAKLLTMAMDYIGNNDFEISMLVTGVHKHYEGYGYVTQENYINEVDLRMDRNVCEMEALEVNNLSVEKVANIENCISLFSQLYKEYASKYNGTIVRDHEGYWKKWFKHEATKNNRKLCLIKSEKEVIGYILYEVKVEKIYVTEYIGPDKEFAKCVLLEIARNEQIDKAIISAVIDTNLQINEEIKGNGWMYRNSGDNDFSLQAEGRKDQFVMWPVDGF